MKPEREQRLQALVDQGKIKWSAQNTRDRDVNNTNLMSMSNSSSSSTSISTSVGTGMNEDKKWNKIFNLLTSYGMAQGGCEGCCNIHLKGSVMNATTGQTSTLGVWLMRQRRQKFKGWINPSREAKVLSPLFYYFYCCYLIIVISFLLLLLLLLLLFLLLILYYYCHYYYNYHYY